MIQYNARVILLLTRQAIKWLDVILWCWNLMSWFLKPSTHLATNLWNTCIVTRHRDVSQQFFPVWNCRDTEVACCRVPIWNRIHNTNVAQHSVPRYCCLVCTRLNTYTQKQRKWLQVCSVATRRARTLFKELNCHISCI